MRFNNYKIMHNQIPDFIYLLLASLDKNFYFALYLQICLVFLALFNIFNFA